MRCETYRPLRHILTRNQSRSRNLEPAEPCVGCCSHRACGDSSTGRPALGGQPTVSGPYPELWPSKARLAINATIAAHYDKEPLTRLVRDLAGIP